MREKVYVHFQVEIDLKNELIVEASKKGLSLNSYIRMILLERKK